MADERTNVISWQNPGPEDILWEYDQEYIRTYSSLTVDEWQWAVFVRDGQILRVFDAGKYQLTTANFPFLTKIYEKVLGFKENVFKAKVIVVTVSGNTKHRLEGGYLRGELHTTAEVSCMPYLVDRLEKTL